MSTWKKVGIFLVPVLFAVYPVLAMFSHSLGEISFFNVLRTIIFSVIFAVGLTLLLRVILSDWQKASLIATCWLLVFYTYGDIHDVLLESVGPQIGRHMVLLPIAAFVMIGTALWIWKSGNSSKLYAFLALMAVILIAMVTFFLANYYIASIINRPVSSAPITISTTSNSNNEPDIYYIILDGYGREDILQELYGYDNSEFIEFLQQHGFYVADSSHSNYAQTTLSLSSSLNMEYLDKIGLPTSSAQKGRSWLTDKIKHSLVRQLLARQGYRMVSFSNSDTTSVGDADIYFNFAATKQAVNILHLNEFENMFISSTLGQVPVDLGWISSNRQLYLYRYAQVKYTFDKLADIPNMPGNYFVFAHILAPHPPFVFSSDGGFVDNKLLYSIGDGSTFKGSVDDYITGYRNQVSYVDLAMENVIDKILTNSTPSPLIIIQGDHGPGAYLHWESEADSNLDERLSILNAYHFPGDQAAALYPAVTPVNSFRILFNEYFGMNFPPYDDRSYFSTWSHPFNYMDVTDKLKK